MMQKKAEGEWMHQAPFGYRNTRDAEGRAVLELDPSEARYILKAWELKENGVSVRKISKLLLEKESTFLAPLFGALSRVLSLSQVINQIRLNMRDS